MIDLYTWKTDNGFKALHGFEESGVEYTLKPVNLQEKEQFDPDYMKISPAHKIPAIIDHDGPGGETVSLCESGAILKYIATKAGGFIRAILCNRLKSISGCFLAPRNLPRLLSNTDFTWSVIQKMCRQVKNTTPPY